MPLATDVVILNGDTAVSNSNPLPTTATISGSITVNSAAQATASPPSYVEGAESPFSQTLTGDLRTIAKQSGIWTVQPGNTANTTAWLVTGTGGTFPATQSGSWTVTASQATAASLNATVVGTGTFAVQAAQSGTWTVTGSGGVFPVTQTTSPWIVAGGGTAGTAATGVATIQGIASMTPVQVSQATAGNLNATVVGTGTFAVQATLAAETTKVIGTVNQGTSPWVTSATQSGTWNIGTVTTVSTVTALTSITNALPAGTNLLGKTGIDQTTPGTTNAVSLAQIGSTTAATGNGVVGAGVQRVAIASDNTAFSVNAAITAASGSFVSGSQNIGITPTDRTITSMSGASQQLMAANASRKAMTIMNTGTSNVGINPTGGAAVIGGAGTLTLVPNGAYTPRVPSLSAVNVIGTAAQPVYADEA
jgi:hypothetical protein